MDKTNTKTPYIWLSGLSMLCFLATNIYLPAFDILRQDLATSTQMIGWSLSIFLLAMSQLIDATL